MPLAAPIPAAADLSSMLFAHVYTATKARFDRTAFEFDVCRVVVGVPIPNAVQCYCPGEVLVGLAIVDGAVALVRVASLQKAGSDGRMAG